MVPPAPPGELFGSRTPMFAGGATGNEKSICVVVPLLRFFRRAFLTAKHAAAAEHLET